MSEAEPSRGGRRGGGQSSAQSVSPTTSPGEREASAAAYLPLVFGLAKHFGRTSPAVETQELVSAGTVGLMEALHRYEPGRGVPIGTFAYHRIRGAIVDELRSQLRHWIRRRGRPPQEVSLQTPLDGAEEPLELIEVTPDVTSPEPGRRAELTSLVDAVSRLPAREREMLAQQTSGFTLAEIARRQGCSISRASVILARARERLEDERAA